MLVGFAGHKQVGKDTAAQVLVENYDFIKVSFSTPLKEMCSEVLGLSSHLFNDAALKDSPLEMPVMLTARDIVQLAQYAHDRFSPLTDEIVNNMTQDELKVLYSPRQLLQFVGTNLFRKHTGSDYWVKAAEKVVDRHRNVVMPDIRFKEERDFINNNKGMLILIKKSDENAKDEHESENSLGELDEYNTIVYNDGSKCELWENVELLCKLYSKYLQGKISLC